MVKIYCKNTGQSKMFNEGSYLADIVGEFDFERPYPILAAKVNNVVEGLKYRIFNNRDVEFLDFRTYAGRNVYCRSLCFLLHKAAQDLFPGCHLTMRRPISKGYYVEMVKADGSVEITEEEIAAIRKRMQQIVLAKLPFRRHEVRIEEAIELFSSIGCEDKVKLLSTSDRVYVSYYTLDGTPDIYYGPLLPSVEHLKVWNLQPYHEGMLLRVPDRRNPKELAPFVDQPKTFDILKESMDWNRIMGLKNVGDVNKAIQNGGTRGLIQVSEALQEKKIVHMAEEIYDKYMGPDKIRLVLITGPSSSGKTSICKKLSTQLSACGLKPISFSTDDYFVNRVDTPKLPDGSYDFDNFDTVDHDALQKDLMRLLSGERVEVPEYNFVTGIREYNGKTLCLEDNSILIIEGIHALNPKLTDMVPQKSIFKIFINAITSSSLDDHNGISTSDNRLLRRIIRDYNKGAFSARQTIANWPNVRRAESQWIYPFQENADVLFNSAYLVEMAVVRSHAEKILNQVPRSCPEYSEAHRLLKTLQFFNYVSDKDVPATSMLRSFIGGNE